MATIVTRSGKGSPLTNNEVDANFTNLNSDKVETSSISSYGASLVDDANAAAARTTLGIDTNFYTKTQSDARYEAVGTSNDDALALAIALG